MNKLFSPFKTIVFCVILIISCDENNDTVIPEIFQSSDLKEKSANNPTAGIIDDFNDDLISNMWEVGTSEMAFVYEDDGFLNINIEQGSTSNGWNQVGGLTSKDFIIQGDFDVQIDFFLCPDYHLIEEGNTLLMLLDMENDGIEISVRTGHYESKEVPAIGPGFIINYTPANHLNGKLRISRVGNLIKTFYWENGWVNHAQWEPTLVSGDLKVTFYSWNMEPYFSGFETKLDNLILNKGFITVCHKPGTIDQKTLTLPPEALNAHLDHGDYIGQCE